jgi:MFS family permease
VNYESARLSQSQKTEPYANKWIVLMVVSVGIFISCMDGSMVNIATPSIAVTMGILPQTAQWVVTAYLLCITATLLLFGRIGDLIGGKPVYSTGFLIFAIGSGLCSQAGNVWLLALCRAFQAIGASMLMSTGMGIVTASFPPSQRGQALGTTGTVVALGTLTGPILGGFIVGTWDWSKIFYLNVFLGVIGFYLAYRYLPNHSLGQTNQLITDQETGPTSRIQRLISQIIQLRQQLDLVGFGLFALGIILFLLSLGQGPTWGWQNPLTLIFGIAGLNLLFLFIYREKRVKFPLLDLNLFQNWTFASGISASILAYMVSFFVSFWIPFYLGQVLLLTPQQMGLIMTAIPLTMAVVSPTAGWLSDRIGYQTLTCLGLIITTFALINLSLLGPSALIAKVVVGLGVYGLGMSLFNAPNNSSVMGSVPLFKLGIAGGVVATGRNLGMVLGVTLSSAVFAYFSLVYSLSTPTCTTVELSREVYAASIARVFQVAAVISTIAAGISILRANSKKSD